MSFRESSAPASEDAAGPYGERPRPPGWKADGGWLKEAGARALGDIASVAAAASAGAAPSHVTYAFHKPLGLTVEQGSAATHGAAGRAFTLNDWIERLSGAAEAAGRLSAVGRLDKNTSGLLLLTTDGRFNERILRPGACTKVYEATVKLRAPARPTDEQMRQLMDGVELQDGPAAAASAEVVAEWSQQPDQSVFRRTQKKKRKRGERVAEGEADAADGGGGDGGGGEGSGAASSEAPEEAAAAAGEAAADATAAPLPVTNVCVIRLAVSIGRHRVVRRLLAAVGLPVFGLKRVSIGGLHLTHDLNLTEPGQACRLSAEQEAALRSACGYTPAEGAGEGGGDSAAPAASEEQG